MGRSERKNKGLEMMTGERVETKIYNAERPRVRLRGKVRGDRM
jgi:hypothetical protein